VALGKISGFGVSIEKSNGSAFRGCANISNFRIDNPKDLFENADFLTGNQLIADIDMSSLLKDTIVVEKLVIDIGDIAIVTSASGTKNFLLFSENLLQKFPSGKSSVEKNHKSRRKSSANRQAKPFLIQKFVLSIGTITTIDESSNSTQKLNVNYSREFTNVSNFSSLETALIADFGKYGLAIIIEPIISSITGLPKGSLDGVIKVKDFSMEAVNKVSNVAGNVGGTIGKEVKKLFKKK
jgi:hypothetical protein